MKNKMGRLTIHEIEKTASELMYYKDKLANGIFGDKIGCFDKAMEALKELQKYKDLEEQGRLIELPDCEAKELLINIVANEVNVCPVNMGFEQEGNCNDGCYACWKKYL